MIPQRDETEAALWRLVLEVARPSWRFRMLFSAHERQLLGFAINTFMSQRQQNLLMGELDRRYGNNRVGSMQEQLRNPGAEKQSDGYSRAP
jgi:hypothetical protein